MGLLYNLSDASLVQSPAFWLLLFGSVIGKMIYFAFLVKNSHSAIYLHGQSCSLNPSSLRSISNAWRKWRKTDKPEVMDSLVAVSPPPPPPPAPPFFFHYDVPDLTLPLLSVE